MVTGGIIIYRLGIVRMLQTVLLLKGVLVGIMVFSITFWQNKSVVTTFIACINLCIVLAQYWCFGIGYANVLETNFGYAVYFLHDSC